MTPDGLRIKDASMFVSEVAFIVYWWFQWTTLIIHKSVKFLVKFQEQMYHCN